MTFSRETKEPGIPAALLDDAYRLWTERFRLDREERPVLPAPSIGTHRPPDAAAFRKAIRDVKLERVTAPDGRTYARLKAIHPDATDDDLKSAIRRAVKFDTDCSKNFSYREPNYFDDCRRAVEISRVENPGFSDETYQRAESLLMQHMR